jgi:hypothetical protein
MDEERSLATEASGILTECDSTSSSGSPDDVLPDDPLSSREEIEIGLLLEGVFRQYGYDFRNYARASI